jgi:hypothetical protein
MSDLARNFHSICLRACLISFMDSNAGPCEVDAIILPALGCAIILPALGCQLILPALGCHNFAGTGMPSFCLPTCTTSWDACESYEPVSEAPSPFLLGGGCYSFASHGHAPTLLYFCRCTMLRRWRCRFALSLSLCASLFHCFSASVPERWEWCSHVFGWRLPSLSFPDHLTS